MSFLTAIENSPTYSRIKADKNSSVRAFCPTEMWERITPCLTPAGITRVADITALDWVGLPVWTAIRPNSYSLSVSQGKGRCAVEAKLGAAMEALEGYIAERPGLFTRQGSFNELRAAGLTLLDPLLLPRLLDSLYHADYSILWARGEDILNKGDIWVPARVVDLDLRLKENEELLFMRSSSGLASGGELPEALYHALIEVIERDAWTIFMDTVVPGDFKNYRCDLTTVRDESLQSLLLLLEKAGLVPVVLDITQDIALPAMACLLFEAENCQKPLLQRSCYMGSGCSHNPYQAMEQAIMEAVQGRLTLISGSRDDINRSKYENSFTQYMWESLGHLLKKNGGRNCAKLPQYGQKTLGEDIQYVLDELRRIGIGQVAAFDLSRPEWPFKVVRVVVPQLETAFHIQGITRGARHRHFMELRHGH